MPGQIVIPAEIRSTLDAFSQQSCTVPDFIQNIRLSPMLEQTAILNSPGRHDGWSGRHHVRDWPRPRAWRSEQKLFGYGTWLNLGSMHRF